MLVYISINFISFALMLQQMNTKNLKYVPNLVELHILTYMKYKYDSLFEKRAYITGYSGGLKVIEKTLCYLKHSAN